LLQQRDDDTGRRILASVPSERYPVIRSEHSDFDQFLSSLPALTSRLNDLVDRASRLVSDNNIRAGTRLLDNLDRAAGGLPHTVQNLDALVDSLRVSADSGQRLLAELHDTTGAARVDFLATMQRLRATSDNLASASNTLNNVATENRAQLHAF